MNPSPYLVADMGGTNSYFSLVTCDDAEHNYGFSSMHTFSNAVLDYSHPVLGTFAELNLTERVRRVEAAFDPRRLFNPDRLFP